MWQKQRKGLLPWTQCHFCEKMVVGEKGLTDHLYHKHKLGIGNKRIRDNMKEAASGKYTSEPQANS